MNGFFAGASADDLVLLDPRTGTKTLLLKAKHQEEGISWAPTGDRLAVISGSQLIVVEAGGSGSQVLRENNCVGGPTTWSPDATPTPRVAPRSHRRSRAPTVTRTAKA